MEYLEVDDMVDAFEKWAVAIHLWLPRKLYSGVSSSEIGLYTAKCQNVMYFAEVISTPTLNGI